MRTPLLVVLAGGASSRLWPLEEKSLIKFMGRPLLSLQLERYAQLGIEQAVIVANPENRDVIADLVATLPEIETEVVVQPEPKGMGDALLKIRPYLDAHGNQPIYITQVHDLTDIALHQDMLTAYQTGSASSYLAGYRVVDYFPGGYLEVGEGGRITNIIEKPGAGNEPSDLVAIVAHVHTDAARLLDAIQAEYAKPDASDDHYERAMAALMAEHVFQVVPYSGPWQAVKFPWHVLDVMFALLSQIAEPRVSEDAIIEEGVLIKGNVVIEAGARLFHGATVVGPAYIGQGAIVGNNALVRESMVGERSVVGYCTEVARSYLADGVHTHVCQALDSILDDDVNLSASCTTANLRIDHGPVGSTIKGQRVSTGRDKLGLIAGKGAFIGVNVMTMPGVKIGRKSEIGPTTVVQSDVPDGARVWVEQTIQVREQPKG
ncbi:sugar phosphate nucleotidyltransferase [Aggregatilinea lenta]|uniref:sugar phosphate nucleotidyltransferase n=1 Tax=Aggregatilinea lenta TaxID=913108 RepID=UPI0013C2EE69|nr:sugar phosphate nucleotidyltransferase [Aggregatilinea lenta]